MKRLKMSSLVRGDIILNTTVVAFCHSSHRCFGESLGLNRGRGTPVEQRKRVGGLPTRSTP